MTEPVDLAEMAQDIAEHWFGWPETRERLAAEIKTALESAHLAGQRLMQERAAECVSPSAWPSQFYREIAEEVCDIVRALVPELPG